MEWREKKPGEWWLVFEDSPPLGEKDARGMSWPPSLTVNFATGEGGSVSEVKSCLHLYSWLNGQMPHEPITNENDQPDYLHICDLDDTIAELVALRDTLRERGLLPTSPRA